MLILSQKPLVLVTFRAQGFLELLYPERTAHYTGYSLSLNDKDPCLYKHHLAILIWSVESMYKDLWLNGQLASFLSVCSVKVKFGIRLAWEGRENISSVSCHWAEMCESHTERDRRGNECSWYCISTLLYDQWYFNTEIGILENYS